MYQSSENLNQKEQEQHQNIVEVDEVDSFLKSTSKYIRLPQRSGESITYQFFNDKAKRKLVTKVFVDPVTKQENPPQTKVEYTVLDPTQVDQGEKLLEVPKTLAHQIEANVSKGNCLLEITRYGTGINTRYTVVVV